MAQLSRPYQIALVAVVALGAVFLLAVHGRTSGSGSSTATPAPAASSPSSSGSSQGSAQSSAPSAAEQAGAPSGVYHGSVPGVEGLSRAIAKAHGAVATSQQNAKQLEEKSAQASNASAQTSTAPAQSPTSARAQTGTSTSAAPSAASGAATHSTALAPSPTSRARSAAAAARALAPQRAVESQLQHGNIVVILFWNPKGADDASVQRELQLLASLQRGGQPQGDSMMVQSVRQAFGPELNKALAVHEARASQVATFGSVTRGAQVYGTPTLLILNKKGSVIELTGLQDAYAIEQAIVEARSG